VRGAGVVGEGGAGFPAHVKYDTQVETVIANGCECEPLLHSDQHLMRNHAGDRGALQKLVPAAGASRGVIAFKRNTPRWMKPLSVSSQAPLWSLARLDNFYPGGR
jgi:Na+-translocating ferredoxin:NAD+ oxidoreductase RnfC subunit